MTLFRYDENLKYAAKLLHFSETCKYILPKNVDFLHFIPLRRGLCRYNGHF